MSEETVTATFTLGEHDDLNEQFRLVRDYLNGRRPHADDDLALLELDCGLAILHAALGAAPQLPNPQEDA